MKKDSFNANEIPADKGLSGNEKIEEAIAALQEEPSQELLAHTLTVIRRRMQEDGQLILAVEPPAGEKHSSGFRQCRLQMESSGGLLLQDLRKN